ncbi:MAG: glycosyltransferase family 9 protein [Lautropia sp.]
MRPIIVRLPNWIGDVVMALPALQRLDAQGWRPVLVGKGWAGSLLSGHAWPVHRHPAGVRERVRMLRRIARDAGARHDAPPHLDCLLLTNSFSSALEARLAGLRALGHASDARGWLLARAVTPTAGAHEIDRFDALSRQVGAAPGVSPDIAAAQATAGPQTAAPRPVLRVSEDAQREAERLLVAAGIDRRFACIVPFATGTLGGVPKAWPGFDAFAPRLAARLPVVVLPGPGEDAAARERFASAVPLAGVGLDAYAAILSRAAVVVANDTGPGHVAAAVGAPLVSVLGPTDASRHGARGAHVHLLQGDPWPSVDAVESATRRWID